MCIVSVQTSSLDSELTTLQVMPYHTLCTSYTMSLTKRERLDKSAFTSAEHSIDVAHRLDGHTRTRRDTWKTYIPAKWLPETPSSESCIQRNLLLCQVNQSRSSRNIHSRTYPIYYVHRRYSEIKKQRAMI